MRDPEMTDVGTQTVNSGRNKFTIWVVAAGLVLFWIGTSATWVCLAAAFARALLCKKAPLTPVLACCLCLQLKCSQQVHL